MPLRKLLWLLAKKMLKSILKKRTVKNSKLFKGSLNSTKTKTAEAALTMKMAMRMNSDFLPLQLSMLSELKVNLHDRKAYLVLKILYVFNTSNQGEIYIV